MDETNLDRPITYRQLLASASSNSSNHPLRVIALCDIDAAYAQFEMSRLGLSADKPVAVQQWQGLIAVNYPARSYGISRHETIADAMKKCPDLIRVHVATYKEGEDEAGYWENADPKTHKVSLDPYRRESVKIIDIFSQSNAIIEKASIDEAFLDFTWPVRDLILKKYPYLANPPNGDLDATLPHPPSIESWDGLLIENNMQDHDVTWSDVALSLGAQMMASCRENVRQKLGYTCSSGISINKLLAKLCASCNKPDGQTVLRRSAIEAFLKPYDFQKIRFLGGKLGNAVAESYDVAKVEDLLNIPVNEMQRTIGEESGLRVWQMIRGIDRSEVTPKRHVKSMQSAKNFRQPLTNWDDAVHWLKVLSVELRVRLTEAREDSPGIWPKTITLHLKLGNISRSHQERFVFTSNLTTEYIHKYGIRLLSEFMPSAASAVSVESETAKRKQAQAENDTSDKDTIRTGILLDKKIITMLLSFHGLERVADGQQNIQGFFKATSSPKKTNTNNAANNNNNHSNLHSPQKEQISNNNQNNKRESSSQPDDDVETLMEEKANKRIKLPTESFVCSRCEEILEGLSDPNDSANFPTIKLLEDVITEHNDHHFAQDLMDQERKIAKQMHETSTSSHKRSKESKKAQNSNSNSTGTSKSKPTTKIEKKGIQKFFAPSSK